MRVVRGVSNVPYKSRYLQYDDFENTDITSVDDLLTDDEDDILACGLIFPEGDEDFSDDLGDKESIEVMSSVSGPKTFQDLMKFNIQTCRDLLNKDIQNNNTIVDFMNYCNACLSMSDNRYLGINTPKIGGDCVTNTTVPKYNPSGGFIPLQVEMVSIDQNGNSKKIDVSGASEGCSIDDICTVCADDEF